MTKQNDQHLTASACRHSYLTASGHLWLARLSRKGSDMAVKDQRKAAKGGGRSRKCSVLHRARTAARREAGSRQRPPPSLWRARSPNPPRPGPCFLRAAGQRRCISREGSGNTQGKGAVSATKAVETHKAKALSQPRRQ